VLRGALRGPDIGEDARQHRDEDDRRQSEPAQRGAQHQRTGAGQDSRRQRAPEDGGADEVRRAGQHEEGDAAAGDATRAHPALAQSPGSEGETADAPGRQQDVGALLRHPDLVAEPPAEPGAEDATEGDDVGQAGPDLEGEQGHQPDRVGVREALSHLAEPRQRADQQRDDQDQQAEPGGPAGEAADAQLARQRFRRGDGHPQRSSQPRGIRPSAARRRLEDAAGRGRWAAQRYSGSPGKRRSKRSSRPGTLAGFISSS
jgi:hypothetical protein